MYKSARKTVGDKTVYVATLDEGRVAFYYQDVALSVERKVTATIEADMTVATSIFVLNQMVSALPNEEEILVQVEDGRLMLKWGSRDSHIAVDLLPETAAMLEVPTPEHTLTWKAGALHGLTRMMIPFCALSNNEKSHSLPAILGVMFRKEETGEVYLRATDSFKYVRCLGKIDWFDNTISLDAQTLQAVSDVLPPDADVTVGLTKSGLVMFKTGAVTCVLAPLEGTLPYANLDKAFNYDAAMKVRVDRLELLDLLRRVRAVCPANRQFAMLEFKDGGIVASTAGGEMVQDLGGTVEGGGVKAVAIHATHMDIAASFFAAPFFKDCDELVLYVNHYKEPITIGVDGQDRVNMTVLPIIISEIESLNNSAVKKATGV
ncbi:DNA polymerase III sliding clamp (beta) subunit (PCNA family) [Paenibacillus mucilaginosus]